ncbi:MAG: uncharacterized protein A8A55_1703 [Amphiamblys sp. WSBS2006]|nr:MAG: uncharacterized protein A8A55_1703 [Amphiamblys sp. WSBS2006]
MFSPKHQRRVDAVYPRRKPYDVCVAEKLMVLVSYINHRPVKIAKVSSYLERKTRTDVQYRRGGHLRITLHVINTILRECREVVGEFTSSVLKLLSIINGAEELDILTHSAETFSFVCALIHGHMLHVHYHNDVFESVVRDYGKKTYGELRKRAAISTEEVRGAYESAQRMVSDSSRLGSESTEIQLPEDMLERIEDWTAAKKSQVGSTVASGVFLLALQSGIGLEGFTEKTKDSRISFYVSTILSNIHEREDFFCTIRTVQRVLSLSAERNFSQRMAVVFLAEIFTKAAIETYRRVVLCFIEKAVIEEGLSRDSVFIFLRMTIDLSPAKNLPSILTSFLVFLRSKEVENSKKLEICIYMQYVLNSTGEFVSFNITELIGEVLSLLRQECGTKELCDSFSLLTTGIVLSSMYWTYCYEVVGFILQKTFMEQTDATQPSEEGVVYKRAVWRICMKIGRCIEGQCKKDGERRLVVPASLLDTLLALCLDYNPVYRRHATEILFFCLRSCPPTTWKEPRGGCLSQAGLSYVSQTRATMFLQFLESNHQSNYIAIYFVFSLLLEVPCQRSILLLASVFWTLQQRKLSHQVFAEKIIGCLFRKLGDVCGSPEAQEYIRSCFAEKNAMADINLSKMSLEDWNEEEEAQKEPPARKFEIEVLFSMLQNTEKSCSVHGGEDVLFLYMPQSDLKAGIEEHVFALPTEHGEAKPDEAGGGAEVCEEDTHDGNPFHAMLEKRKRRREASLKEPFGERRSMSSTVLPEAPSEDRVPE